MNILVLGGTGAIGTPLVQLLSKDNKVTVTSRSAKQPLGNINYVRGNAKDLEFIASIINQNYDVIVDFMVYSTEQFKERLNLFLDNCKQYLYFSSSRVYANSGGQPIVENSSRLLDVCTDDEYLKTDEYALAKARQENLLRESGKTNWTIIRPYITYNSHRLQLGVYEKENWLFRTLKGRTIVLPEDIANSKTTLTYGLDVAKAIERLVGNEKAYGETFHITTSESKTWKEILQIYVNIIEKYTGIRPKIKYVANSKHLHTILNKYQIIYDRLYDREFDNSKIINVADYSDYMKLEDGLSLCISEFLKEPKFLGINWRFEAWADNMSGDKTKLKDINGFKNKLKYVLFKHGII